MKRWSPSKLSERQVAFFALIVSLIGLALSIFNTIYFQRLDFNAARTLTLRAETVSKHPLTNEELSDIKFEATSPDFNLEEITIYFPSQISPAPITFHSPFEASLLVPLSELRAALKGDVPIQPPPDPITYINGEPLNLWNIADSLPVVIDSHYTVKGEAFHRRALYDFTFVYVLSPRGQPDKFGDTVPQFTGLKLIQQLGETTDPAPLLKSRMQAKKFTFD